VRRIFHNLQSLISVGTDVTEECDVFVAIAACNRKDQPERKLANEILNGRLDSEKGKKRFFMGNYAGEAINADVFGPIHDAVRALDTRRNVDTLAERILDILNLETPAPAACVSKMNWCEAGQCGT